VLNVVARCFRVEQKVKTRLSARCVFSRDWKNDGHGMALVTGVEKEEALRESAGGCLGLGVRRGFIPPSCVFVGIVEMLDEASDPVSEGAGEGQSVSTTSFRLRFRTIRLETVAACSFCIAGFVVGKVQHGGRFRWTFGLDDIETRPRGILARRSRDHFKRALET
jgi:hypothetical protein